jgi:hypothetical protein
MGLISDILGGLRANGKPVKRTVAEVEKALSKLAAERTAAREAVTKAMRKRDELLLIDDTDKKIDELDAAADRCRLTLERCEKAEPLLLGELAALRTEAKQARWRDLRSRYETASRDYTNVLREAVAKQGAMLALNDLARSEGFETEVIATFTPPMRILTADGLNEFELALDRQRDAEEAMRAAPPAPVAAMPAKAPTKVAPKAPPSPAPTARPGERIIQPGGEGLQRLVVVRSGIEIDDVQYGAGDIIALPHDKAQRLLRSSGAVDRYPDAAA